MITTSGLGKSYGDRTLFEGVDLVLNAGSRYGLVGANGAGKTTFLKVLAGDEQASEGSFSFAPGARIGVLRQDLFLDDAEIILDLAMRGDRKTWEALRERARIIDHGEGDPNRLAELEDTLVHFDGHTLEARATTVLIGLGIPASVHRMPLSTLSGGFKLRVLLAQVLLGGPDVLLLDEPTNHLDILSIRWLETFLAQYRGVAVVISHDQRFLDHVATHILDVDYGTITTYVGNYGTFAREKVAIRERKEKQIARAEEQIAEKRAFVDRFGAKATKAKQAQSRLKQIEKIEVEELAQSSRRAPFFRFDAARPGGKEVLEAVGVSKSYGSKEVLKNVSLTVRRGEKVGVIGPNGLGKSTLLKIVMGRVERDSGTVRTGHDIQTGYFAQDHKELFPDPKTTPLDFVWDACRSESQSYVRGQLGRMLFSGQDVTKTVGSLSGGEAARLVFSKILVQKPNFLVLDEPTNHLDLESIDALVSGLAAFDGTVLFVSHDRHFVASLATRILEVTPSGIRDFPGTYAEYLERAGDDHLDVDVVVKKAKADRAPSVAPAATPVAASPMDWESQKRERNRLANLPKRRDKLLADIERAEKRRATIAQTFAAPGYFDRASAAEQKMLTGEDAALAAKIEAWLAEWEEVETELGKAAS